MDFAPTDSDTAVLEAMRAALRPLAPRRDEIMRAIHRDKAWRPEIWEAFRSAGIFESYLPEAYGGTGLGITAMALAVEEAARHGFGNAIAILTCMDALCILRNGSEELKRRILPEVAAGRLRMCFAVTEADAGSNTFRITTRAERRGDHYEITGQKTYITGADRAEKMLLVARTTSLEEAERRGLGKSHGLSLFLVPTDAPGLEKRPIPTRGIEGMTQYTIFMDQVRVPAADLVGEPDTGAVALFTSLNPERILAAATANGLTHFMLERSCAYARERKVFKDRPIGAYQAIQHPLAECRIALDAARLLVSRACWAFDKELDPATVGHYANMAKFAAADLGVKACDAAIETHGGNGFSEEYGIIYLWDAMRLLKTAPISREMILNYTAEHVLGLPRSY